MAHPRCTTGRWCFQDRADAISAASEYTFREVEARYCWTCGHWHIYLVVTYD